MTLSRNFAIQAVRWLFIGISVYIGGSFIFFGAAMLARDPISWLSLLWAILTIALTTPFALFAYFSIRRQYKDLLILLISLFSIALFFATSSVFHKANLAMLYSRNTSPVNIHTPLFTPLFEALAGLFLSILPLAAPYILASFVYRSLMKRVADHLSSSKL